MAPGVTGSGSGRPRFTPEVLYHSFLIPKNKVILTLDITNQSPLTLQYTFPTKDNDIAPKKTITPIPYPVPTLKNNEIPLYILCHGRSGDKGDVANIGIICRKKEYFSFISDILTEEVVKNYLSHLILGSVKRYEIPGLNAFNFVCTKSLGGGGLSSLNMDRQGKCYAQMLLDLPIVVHPNLLVGSPKL